ncbi:MAG: hypothetical protein MJ175_06350 [Clostridia bacterium]|nr:hypothetical protein [Clostridia bacterium]
MNKELLLAHFARYPLMQPTDAVKLLYQNTFGGGHLIRDPEKALAYLEEERARTPETPAVPLYEDIGGGLVRLNLAAPDCRDLPSDLLLKMFSASAAHVLAENRTQTDLEDAFALLYTVTAEGKAPFTLAALDEYLDAYRAAGYPMVSHSENYRNAYCPAYRIIQMEYLTILPAAKAISRLLMRRSAAPVVIAIDGPAASGKTTAAAALADLFFFFLFHMADYFLPFDMRTEERLAAPGGNVHYERFKKEILDGIASAADPRGSGLVVYRPFDCSDGTLKAPVSVPYKRLNIIEGSYAHHPHFGDCYDLRVFLTISPEEQRARILARNGEEMLTRFVERWIPMEEQYFAAFDVESHADIIL